MIKVEILNQKLNKEYKIDTKTCCFYLKIHVNNEIYYVKHIIYKDLFLSETANFFTDENFIKTKELPFYIFKQFVGENDLKYCLNDGIELVSSKIYEALSKKFGLKLVYFDF